MKAVVKIIFLVMFYTIAMGANGTLIHHELQVKITPEISKIEVTDQITIPATAVSDELRFTLHEGMTLESLDPSIKVTRRLKNVKASDVGIDRESFEDESDLLVDEYIIQTQNRRGKDLVLKIKYSGEINQPLEQVGEEYARGFSQTRGVISADGVYLAGSTYWIPFFNDRMITYDLSVSLPEGWRSVSQGKRTFNDINGDRHNDRWEVSSPAEEIYLIAAKFTEYEFNTSSVMAMAFLRTPDETLANKYLVTTAQYLEMYRKLVGPYPYSKFALVENFWETGYGMPSFTLLGEKVIRFPFILHSSYPHELLHNWWGNSVYVDFAKGNWCEGLTAYMADHLIKEQRGQGAEYRRSTLQRFTDYVNSENDFPVIKFRSRSNPSSEAIGYGKSLMMWNMLRQDLGDDVFVKSFQDFYRNNRYKRATFNDIRSSFEKISKKDLSFFFQQWTYRKGAPNLKINSVRSSRMQDIHKVEFELEQGQTDDVFVMNIPVRIITSDSIYNYKVVMDNKKEYYTFTVNDHPLRIEVDPDFDLFRKLDYREIPPSLSKVFGADKILIVLPSKAPKDQLSRYEDLAKRWSGESNGKIEMVSDAEINSLPSDKSVWLFGWHNQYLDDFKIMVKDYSVEIGKEQVRLHKTELTRSENSFIISSRHPKNQDLAVVWLTIHSDEAIAGLARKLPHYGKYSYLAFTGDEPSNIAKGQWMAVNSPMVAIFEKGKTETTSAKTTKRKALAYLAPVFSAKRMTETVQYLASDELKGRGIDTEEINKAADYIAEKFAEAGLLPGGENGTYFQNFAVTAGKDQKQVTVKNVIGYIPGKNPGMNDESVVLSAHYDHLGTGWPDAHKGDAGKIHRGADDNASGVAVMIELAQTMGKTAKPGRAIVFAAFAAEEAGLLGSKYFVKNSKKYPVDKIIGNINLDTVGRLGKNKLMVLNSASAREWKYIFMFSGFSTGVESDMVTQNLDASDQMSFIEAGIPAVQIFSGPNTDYHRPSDTADKIDVDGLLKTATLTKEAIEYLGDRAEKLSFSAGPKTEQPKGKQEKGARRVSSGTIPDFTFSGEGVRLSGVVEGSPAEKEGLQKDDIIIEFSGKKVTGLRDYSDILKSHKPGDVVPVVFLRGDKKMNGKITLVER